MENSAAKKSTIWIFNKDGKETQIMGIFTVLCVDCRSRTQFALSTFQRDHDLMTRIKTLSI